MGDGYWDCLYERMEAYAAVEDDMDEAERDRMLQGIADDFAGGDLLQLRKILVESAMVAEG